MNTGKRTWNLRASAGKSQARLHEGFFSYPRPSEFIRVP
jgi:hypothetical protein